MNNYALSKSLSDVLSRINKKTEILVKAKIDLNHNLYDQSGLIDEGVAIRLNGINKRIAELNRFKIFVLDNIEGS